MAQINQKAKTERVFLHGKCPVCGGKVMVTALGYKCDNPHCSFFIKGVICDRRIRSFEIEDFLQDRNIPIDGFYRRDSNISFPSFLRFSKEKGAYLDSYVGTCPVCGGDIRIGKKAFNCSNFASKEHPCRFFVYRNISGHEMAFSEISQILSNGITDNRLRFFDENGKPFYRKIAFDPIKNIVQI